jgi:hypothetical protein
MSVYLAITIQMGHCLPRPTDTLMSKNGQVLHSILQQHDERKQIFTHISISAYHGQQECR